MSGIFIPDTTLIDAYTRSIVIRLIILAIRDRRKKVTTSPINSEEYVQLIFRWGT